MDPRTPPPGWAGNAERYEAFEWAHAAVLVRSPAGTIRYWNAAAESLYGWSRAEALGKNAQALLPAHASASVEERDAQLLREGHWEGELEQQARDGSSRVVAARWWLERDAAGQPAAVVEFNLDITERFRMEQAAREAIARMEAFEEATFEAIFIHDQGRVLMANRCAGEMFGYKPEELVGMNVLDLAAPECVETVRAHFAKGDPFPYQAVGLRKDGSTFVGELRGKTATLHGRPVRVTAIRDLTEWKRAEEELLEARELDRLKNNFVGAVSHELRTPLSAIMGYAELLEDTLGELLPPAQAEYVMQIQRGARRLERLVDDLLDFARLDAGTFRLRVEPADLFERMRETAESLRPMLEEQRVRLHVALPEEPVPVRMDAQRLDQVLGNLLSNAAKFTPQEGCVRLTGEVEGDRAYVRVTDTGPGIAQEDIPKLFQRFSQLEGGAKKGGTGLGLSISKAIVEAHGGEIGVDSRPGEGSTFWFWLPLRAQGA